MDSSAAAPIAEINLVSSPPTSHAASPSRTSSPLRPSTAAKIPESSSDPPELAKAVTVTPARVASVVQSDAYVANSDPEDGSHAVDTDGADTPQKRRSPSPGHAKAQEAASVSYTNESGSADGSSVYVQIPLPSSPSILNSSSKKKSKEQQNNMPRRRGSEASESAQASSSSIMDDAAYAAALAAQEATLARRRPTRNARKEVSYSPVCDLDGRPLAKKPAATASGSSTKSNATSKESSTKKAKSKRRGRAFSDDEDEEEHEHHSTKASASRAQNDEDDADLTDDDVGFKARDRKKARVSNAISVDSDDDAPPKNAKAPHERKRAADDGEDDAALSEGGEDGILTPPAPTSPRRSSRKSVPSPKKQQLQESAKKGKGKGKEQKTFDLGEPEPEPEAAAQPTAEEQDEDGEQPRTSSRKNAAPRQSAPREKSASPAEEEEAQEAEAEKSAAPASAPRSHPAGTSPAPSRAPTTVAIKRITAASSPSPSASSPSSPGPRSFFGKPLTTLLTPNAARRPGLTRNSNIPSLLHHRGVPKPPAPKLAVSKRRMQDDDYEYDAEYEALIAKDKKGSDDESDNDEPAGGRLEMEEEVVVEYD